MERLQILQKLGHENFNVHEENFTQTKLPPQIYQKFTSWKMQRKHVNQTTTIYIGIKLQWTAII